jgi:hypothetical protein
MRGLQVRQASEQMDVEGRKRAAEQRRPRRPRPPPGHEAGADGGERETGDEQKVEREDRRSAKPPDWRAKQGRYDERLRVRQRLPLRGENVSVKNAGGMHRQRVGDPTDDPLVQLGVRVVIERQPCRRAGKRPRVKNGERQKEARRGCRGSRSGGDGRG